MKEYYGLFVVEIWFKQATQSWLRKEEDTTDILCLTTVALAVFAKAYIAVLNFNLFRW